MTKSEYKGLVKNLKAFVKGNELPTGYEKSFYSAISEEEIWSNKQGENKVIGHKKIYNVPCFFIRHNGTIVFTIEAREDGRIYVCGESNEKEVKTWNWAMETGLDFEANGW